MRRGRSAWLSYEMWTEAHLMPETSLQSETPGLADSGPS